LPPSGYELSASASGFQAGKGEAYDFYRPGRCINLKMSIAAGYGNGVRDDRRPILDVSDSRVRPTINTEQLQDLPWRGRNFFNRLQ